jgi:hypothetical protein
MQKAHFEFVIPRFRCQRWCKNFAIRSARSSRCLGLASRFAIPLVCASRHFDPAQSLRISSLRLGFAVCLAISLACPSRFFRSARTSRLRIASPSTFRHCGYRTASQRWTHTSQGMGLKIYWVAGRYVRVVRVTGTAQPTLRIATSILLMHNLGNQQNPVENCIRCEHPTFMSRWVNVISSGFVDLLMPST